MGVDQASDDPRTYTSSQRKIPYFRRRRDDLHTGDRVTINAPFLKGKAGTLVRPTRLLGKPAWLVEMDHRPGAWGRRTRVAERSLIKSVGKLGVRFVVGERVTVTVSDPWDFTSEDGSNVFVAEVIHARGLPDDPEPRMLVQLAESVRHRGLDWRWFVAQPRDPAGQDWGLIGVTDEQASGLSWAEASKHWRGGSPAARASIARA